MHAHDSREKVESWSLVLAAAGIDHRVLRGEAGWQLQVAPEDEARARLELERYERENVPRPRVPDPPSWGRTQVGLWSAVAIVCAFVATGPFDAALAAHRAGANDARRLLGGELWRSATALTLHVDAPHALGNALAAGVFVSLVGLFLGPGLAAALVVAAGAGGNVLAAWARGPGHLSVGASTAVFAAIGVLCGLQFVRRWRIRPTRGRAWLPLAAGLGLLAMLGTGGPEVDFPAHLFGLATGAAFAVPVAAALERPPGVAAQALLFAAALALLGAAWAAALAAA